MTTVAFCLLQLQRLTLLPLRLVRSLMSAPDADQVADGPAHVTAYATNTGEESLAPETDTRS